MRLPVLDWVWSSAKWHQDWLERGVEWKKHISGVCTDPECIMFQELGWERHVVKLSASRPINSDCHWLPLSICRLVSFKLSTNQRASPAFNASSTRYFTLSSLSLPLARNGCKCACPFLSASPSAFWFLQFCLCYCRYSPGTRVGTNVTELLAGDFRGIQLRPVLQLPN